MVGGNRVYNHEPRIMDQPTLQDVIQAMSTAIAPVFLINGVAIIISSMVLRYNRIQDRARAFGERAQHEVEYELCMRLANQMGSLYKRAIRIRNAIILAALSIFWIALTVTSIFAQLIFGSPLVLVTEATFLLSLLFLMAALTLYISDFARSLRILETELLDARNHAEGLRPGN